jgi:hypothetical protein
MKRAEHLAIWWTEETHTELRWGNLREREREPLEDLGVNLTVILKWIFKKEDGIA